MAAPVGGRQGLLTIDDGPSTLTRGLVDFLRDEGIPSVMFFLGENLERYPDEALYALESGAVVGNHSFTHRAFSSLSPAEAEDEVGRTEVLIEALHRRAGVPRRLKLFRFPYLDKGGARQAEWAALLDRWGFDRLAVPGVTYPWYGPLAADRDVHCTFDFRDYQISNPSFTATWADLLAHLDEPEPAQGGSLVCGDSHEVFLLHDHPHTEAVQPGYYRELVAGAVGRGIRFVGPLAFTGTR